MFRREKKDVPPPPPTHISDRNHFTNARQPPPPTAPALTILGRAALDHLPRLFPPVFQLHALDEVRQLHDRAMSEIITLLLPLHEELEGGVRPYLPLHAQVAVIDAVDLPNEYGQLDLHGGGVILVGVQVVIRSVHPHVLPRPLHDVLAYPPLGHLVHDLRERLPRGREIPAVGAPVREEVDEHERVLGERLRQQLGVEAHGVLAVLVQILDRLLDRRVVQLHVVLGPVALLVSLPDAVLVDGEPLHVLGDVLLRSQDAHDVDGRVIAFEVHHRDVEVDAYLRIGIAVEGEVGLEGRGEEGLRLEEEEGGHGRDRDGREDGSPPCALEEVHGHLAVHVEGGYEGTTDHDDGLLFV